MEPHSFSSLYSFLSISKPFLPLLLSLLFVCTLNAQQVIEVPVWPDGAEESNGITTSEVENNGRIDNISVASLQIYLPAKDKNSGAAVLICPGGGYARLAARHEGSQFAAWYAEQGITGIVLKYRLPNGHPGIPLKDAQEAMRIIRKRSAEWGIDSLRVGVSGFSAGGHLASTLLTHFDEGCRPDFGILFYPVISLDGERVPHAGSKKNLLGREIDNPKQVDYYSAEKQITGETPPALLLLSDDDKAVIPENSILFYRELKANGVPASLHIFPEGGHGWGFNDNFRYHQQMKAIILDWLEQRKILTSPLDRSDKQDLL